MLIMFDVDGTLVHSGRRDSACFAETYERLYQRPFPTLDWQHFPHVTDHTIFGTCIRRDFQRSYTAEEVMRFQDHYMRLLRDRRRCAPHEFQEVPGARRLIHRLMAREDVVVSIATGGWRDPARIKLDHVGLPSADLPIAGGDYRETRIDILQHAMELAGTGSRLFSRTVYLGDAIWDVDTTRAMGLDFVGVRHQGDVDVLARHGSGVVIQDFRSESEFWSAIERARPPIVKKP